METAKNRSNLRYARFEQNILQYYKDGYPGVRTEYFEQSYFILEFL